MDTPLPQWLTRAWPVGYSANTVDKAAFTTYLVTLILSILLFGSVHTYAYTIMTLGVLTGSVLLVIGSVRKDHRTNSYQVTFPNTSLNLAIFLLLVFLILQILPLPEPLLKFLSPETWTVVNKGLPAPEALNPENREMGWSAVSPYEYPVRMSIIRFTVYGLFFLGLIHVLNSRKRVELTISLLLIAGCFEAIYGLGETYSGSNHIWWFKKLSCHNDVTGTYINRNHLAGFMELGLLLAAAYSAGLSLRKKERKAASDYKLSLRGRLSRCLSGEARFNKRTLIVFAGVVMGIGLVFSASRGGMISGAGGMLVMGLLLASRKSHRNKGVILLVLFCLTSVYALHIGVEYPLGRFKSFYQSFESRSRYAQKTMDMFKDYKLTGIGVGNFQYAYPKYQAPEDEKVFIRYAHNDWAQFSAEAGVTGLCTLLVGIVYYLYRTMRLWKRRSDPFAVCLGIAPLACMTAMAIHSYSDFNLHIPANFLILVAIMAIGHSALHLKRHHDIDKMLYRSYTVPLKYRGLVALLAVLAIVFWNGFWTVRHFVAEAYCNTVPNSTLNRDMNPPIEEIEKAIEWDEKNAQYWYKLGIKLRNLGVEGLRSPDYAEKEKLDQKRFQMEIISALEQAVRLNPLEAKYHVRLAWEYTYLWKDPDYHSKWLPTADISMDRAACFAGEKNPRLHVELGNYWVMRSKTIYPSHPEHDAAWAKACRHYKKAQSLEAGQTLKRIKNEIKTYVSQFYPDERFIEQVIK